MARDSRTHDGTRRRLLKVGGLSGLTVLAGCLGDDEVVDDTDDIDDVDDTDDQDDVADVDDIDDVDDVDDVDDADDADPDNVQEVHDATAVWAAHDFAEVPADIQYNPYIDPNLPNDFPFTGAELVGMSNVDFEHYGIVVDDWSYQPGVLEFSFHDDFYWWSGDQVVVDDYLAILDFEDYLWGGEDLEAQDAIVTREQVDDTTVRLALTDSWHEGYALSQTIEGVILNASHQLLDPWIEEFADAPDLDAIEDLRDDFEADKRIETDDELVHTKYSPYEFRLDGSVGHVGENFWEAELVQEVNGNLRHFANTDNYEHLPNFSTGRYEVHEEGDVMQMERYQEQEQPFAYGEITPEAIIEAQEGNAPFETDLHIFFRPPSDQGGMQFNHDTHPTDDAHFRRAMAYLTDNTAWDRHPETIPAQEYHGFFSEEELETFVSQEVIDAFTDYGYDGMQVDEAEAELLAGGYEQDADGRWLMQEDGVEADAGEPMDFTIGTWSWMEYVADHGTDWFADLNDFGIGNEVIVDLPEDWTVLWTYTGGGVPEAVFGNIYLEQDWARPEINVPSVVLAPPFLETADAGASQDDWVEYEVTTMTERLAVTTDEEMYQQLVDELAWVVNQIINHFSISPVARHFALNMERWYWPPLEETAAVQTRLLFRNMHFGVCQYVPEADR